MSQVRLLCQMARWHAYTEVVARLKEIASYVFSQQSVRVAITCGQEIQTENRTSLATLLQTLPSRSLSVSSPIAINQSLPSRAFFSLPYSVNYAALTLTGVPYTHPDSPVLRILAKYIEQKRIHPEIREKGGAYGGRAHYDSLNGIFSYISYRDPSFARSLEIMRESGEWAVRKRVEDGQLAEMKLSVFKGVDSPISVQQEGMQEFLNGITGEMRQT
jgi:presequence protease